MKTFFLASVVAVLAGGVPAFAAGFDPAALAGGCRQSDCAAPVAASLADLKATLTAPQADESIKTLAGELVAVAQGPNAPTARIVAALEQATLAATDPGLKQAIRSATLLILNGNAGAISGAAFAEIPAPNPPDTGDNGSGG